MFLRSPSATSSAPSASTMASACFSTGTDSPVSAASSIFMEALSRTRQSAGTESPASSRITSPGTSSELCIMTSLPSRMTLDWAALISCRAARASSLFASWMTPRAELMMTTAMMMITSAKSGSPWMKPVMAEMAAATISMMTIGSAICWKNRIHMGVGSSSSSLLGPYLARRSAAVAAVRPACSLEPSPSSTRALDSRYSFTGNTPLGRCPAELMPDHNSPARRRRGGARAHQGCHGQYYGIQRSIVP